MTLLGEDQAVGVPEVGAVGEVAACGNCAARRRAVLVPRSSSGQPQTGLPTRSIAHQSQQAVFLELPYAHSSSVSTHLISSGLGAARAWPSTAASTQFSTALRLTPPGVPSPASPPPQGRAPAPPPAWLAPPAGEPLPRRSAGSPGTTSAATQADGNRFFTTASLSQGCAFHANT